MLRDRLLARLAEMGDAPDHQQLAAAILGIRGAPPDLARRPRYRSLRRRRLGRARRRARLAALFADERLFAERLDQH